MYFSFTKKNNKYLYLKYTLAFICVALFVYGTYFISGHSLIWKLDGANQHLPLLVDFRQMLVKFIHHPSLDNLPQWSWHFGLGSNTFPIYSYYLLGDIFAYLVLLFPASKIIFAYQFLIILRLYCAGLSFCWCASHLKLKDQAIISGTLVYLFNAFLLYSNIAQPFFTLPFIIFPILIVNLERVIQGKSIWPLLFTFTWMLINNFYFAYILGLGSIIFLGLRLFWSRHEKHYYFKLFTKLAFATFISLINASFLILPEIIAVHNSTRSGSQFANGIKYYPLYYYLALPGQLINGGNRDFYFWSALGFASIAFFAILYILIHFKQFKIIGSILILGVFMLLVPACGAVFNGFMAPSNRWTLMLCLPIALACAILVEKVNLISTKNIKFFVIATTIYTLFIGISYLFQNNQKIFIPMIFIMVFLITFILLQYFKVPYAQNILLGMVLLNVIFNAIYFEAPYNEGYSNEMLPQGSFKKLTLSQYGDLTKDLNNNDNYRVSTISQNSIFGVGYHMYNNQDPHVNMINSYYSLQNKYIGDFAQQLQNTQFEANIPLDQFSDRTIVNNFLGVKYIFVQSNQKNATKIPEGYILNKTSWQNTYNNQQIQRFKTDQNFPLLYWQPNIITPKTYHQLTPTEKERSLADGILVNSPLRSTLPKVKKGNIQNQVYSLPFKLISSHGNVIDSHHIEKLDPNEDYIIVIDSPLNKKEYQKFKKQLQGCELHLEFENIKYSPLTLNQQVTLEENQADHTLNNGALTQNNTLNHYRYLRNNILDGTPNSSFTISCTTPLSTEKIIQPNSNALSFYKNVRNGTMNLGYFQNEIPFTIKLDLNNLGNYSFDLKVVAEPLKTQYQNNVSQIQQHSLNNVKFSSNNVKGSIITSQNGILTSSIPYSRGWSVKVNGKKAQLLRTNIAFLGVKLNKGKNNIEFNYHVPGLKLGLLLSISGIIITCISGIITILSRKNK